MGTNFAFASASQTNIPKDEHKPIANYRFFLQGDVARLWLLLFCINHSLDADCRPITF